MPNPATTSITPRMISQMPATSAKVTIESNGHASTTMPARMLMMPKKIAPPRPGSAGSLMAVAVAATPRKMNPTPSQRAKDHRRRAADKQQYPAARRGGQAECTDHLRDARHQQVHTEHHGSHKDRRPWPQQDYHAEDHRQQAVEDRRCP